MILVFNLVWELLCMPFNMSQMLHSDILHSNGCVRIATPKLNLQVPKGSYENSIDSKWCEQNIVSKQVYLCSIMQEEHWFIQLCCGSAFFGSSRGDVSRCEMSHVTGVDHRPMLLHLCDTIIWHQVLVTKTSNLCAPFFNLTFLNVCFAYKEIFPVLKVCVIGRPVSRFNRGLHPSNCDGIRLRYVDNFEMFHRHRW